MSIHYSYNGEDESKITYKRTLENKDQERKDSVTKALKTESGVCYIYSRLCSAMHRDYYNSKREEVGKLNPYSEFYHTNLFSIVIANKNHKFKNKDTSINVIKISCKKFDIYVLQSIADIPSSGNYKEAFKLTIGPNDYEKYGVTQQQAEHLKRPMDFETCIFYHKFNSMGMFSELFSSYNKLYKYSPNIKEIKFYSFVPCIKITKENGEQIEIPKVSFPFFCYANDFVIK
ncbi:hypothetical protein AmDm5_0483 [Acetobacter malorum]|nr:hypothetical protein AmDm5_0483 [Acetobacter malorum]